MSLAQGPSVTLGYIKRNINNAECLSLEACFDAEAMHHSRSGETADHKEAAKAFVEKRKPVFQAIKMAEVIEMTGYIRLRQICLVAPRLEPVISDIAGIMGLSVCYRDGNVAKYGLENALLPVDTILLEVVAPFQPRHRGRALSRQDRRPRRLHGDLLLRRSGSTRGEHASKMGVRVANVIDHAPYHGVQLHPRDCRAAFIEFNHTDGSDDILGPYPPAGPGWQKSIRKDVTQALTGVEMQSPDPQGLAEHWGRIIGIPVSSNQAVSPNSSCPIAASASSRAKARS